MIAQRGFRYAVVIVKHTLDALQLVKWKRNAERKMNNEKKRLAVECIFRNYGCSLDNGLSRKLGGLICITQITQ